ncbi:D-alanine--D-alanine ligase [Streptomyces sp. NPDC050095]|uniref:D-alanine--D-alanine ligase family protein n=1 Tax=unclassified Streptomyces TaxID=2593676 RepID=UPI00344878FA
MEIEPLRPEDFCGPVAVITGGWSRERDRSLLSGATVTESLADMGIKTRHLDLAEARETLVENLADIDVAFLAIAGRGAEDGRLQGLLETLGIDYTGSGVLASAIGMHKLHAKAVVSVAGVKVPTGLPVDVTVRVADEAERLYRTLGLPLIVKPVNEGGSIGLRVAQSTEELATNLLECDGSDAMVEVFHPGRPVSVGVLEEPGGTLHVLPLLEAETADGIYSYEAKRSDSEQVCTYHCPARVEPTTAHALRRQALIAHRALHCHSYSRHDFVVTARGEGVWLEVNTLPGLSRTGNLARMAKAGGLTYEQLLAHILAGARTDRRAKS